VYRGLFLLILVVFAGLLVAGCSQREAVKPPAPPPVATPSQAPVPEPDTPAALEGTKVLLVIAQKDFNDVEFTEPRLLLTDQGATVTVASKKKSAATGMEGAEVVPDLTLAEVKVPEYDAVVFIGGSGASVYFDDPEALAIAREAAEENKIVAAICLAPGILAKAGLLKGEDATITESRSDLLTESGANYTGPGVVESGLFVTASGPDQAQAFAEKLAELLSHPEG